MCGQGQDFSGGGGGGEQGQGFLWEGGGGGWTGLWAGSGVS